MLPKLHKAVLLSFVLTMLLGVTPMAYNALQYTAIQQQLELKRSLVLQSHNIDTSTSYALALAKEASSLAEQLCISSVGAINCQR